jgi:hypothetical protein
MPKVRPAPTQQALLGNKIKELSNLMAFEILANLVETHTTELTHLLAKEILARQLSSYQNDSEATLIAKAQITLTGVISYLRSSDPTEYRNFIQELTLARLNNGYSAEDFYTVVEITAQAVKALIDRELTEPTHTKVELERYHRRIDGMQTLTQSTLVATRSAFHKQAKQA